MPTDRAGKSAILLVLTPCPGQRKRRPQVRSMSKSSMSMGSGGGGPGRGSVRLVIRTGTFVTVEYLPTAESRGGPRRTAHLEDGDVQDAGQPLPRTLQFSANALNVGRSPAHLQRLTNVHPRPAVRSKPVGRPYQACWPAVRTKTQKACWPSVPKPKKPVGRPDPYQACWPSVFSRDCDAPLQWTRPLLLFA